MHVQARTLLAASTLALFGSNVAHASIVGVTSSGGSEALLTLVNANDSSTITQDLGEQASQIAIGDTYTLTADVLNFINGAGGLGNVRFSVLTGSAANGTAAASYLQSSDNTVLSNIANGVRGTWFTTLNNFIANRLSVGDLTPATDNISYGPFASGTNGNYLTAGMDDWGTAGSCVANDNLCNLVNGTLDAQLFLINFGTSPTGFAGISPLLSADGGALAHVNLDQGRLEITTPVVPLPAAAWLMGSALGLLGMARRRQAGQ